MCRVNLSPDILCCTTFHPETHGGALHNVSTLRDANNMNEELRRRYVRDLLGDLEQIGGARFEQWLRPLWERIAGGPVVAAGLNRVGMPVKSTLDGYWPDLSVSEASSEQDYFKHPYKKARKDFFHAMKAVRDTTCVRLFTTQVAGPKATTDFQNLKHRALKKGWQIDVWDGMRIAGYIVDELLVDDRYVTRVGDALPNLRRIYEQNAASNLVPALSRLSVSRPADEASIVAAMEANKAVVLHGLSGIGKSELACAVAHSRRGQYDYVLWADGTRVQRVEDLRAHDMRLNGYRLNVLGLLSSSKSLLVLDNVKQNLSLDELSALRTWLQCVAHIAGRVWPRTNGPGFRLKGIG